MIMDASTLLSNAQAITATAVSTNIIDLGAMGTVYGSTVALARRIGTGMKVPFLVQVTETFNTLTSLTISLETDDNSAFSSAATVWTSGAVALASLVAGYQVNFDYLPRNVNERYFQMRYTVTGTNPTLGKITAGTTMGNQSNMTI